MPASDRVAQTPFESLLNQILGTEKTQRLRMTRFLTASLTYIACVCIVYACVITGFFSQTVFLHVVLWSIFANTLLYSLFRTGCNRRFRDPALTEFQMVLASGLTLYVMYHAGSVRGTFLLGFMVIYIFGMFALSTRRYLVMVLQAVASYGLLIAVLAWQNAPGFHLKMEVMQWTALAMCLLWLAFIGGYISKLRVKLRSSHEALKEAFATIEQMASRDELTGVHNRRHMMETLRKEKQRIDRSGGVFSVALLDLDHFKQVNDRFGHNMGDRLLQVFAEHCQSHLRSTDSFGRWGGEEFIILLPHTHLEAAHHCVEKIREEFHRLSVAGFPEGYQPSVSGGIAQYDTPAELVDLLERADQGLYRAKEAGRNRIVMTTKSAATHK